MDNDTPIAFLAAHELARRIRRKEFSAVELLDLHLARIARLDKRINAIPVLDAERARDAARDADAALARGRPRGPLHGVPMTVKESFAVAGLPTTFGQPEFAKNIADRDAVAVQRLKAAGAVILGKSNVPRALADWQSFNPVYGTTNNPWDLDRTPGGSSGGSAASLACGFAALELGSDIGASIRNPAHYCGVWGLKPSWGVVPMEGQELSPEHCPERMDICVAGPLARSAADIALAMDILASPLDVATPLGRVPIAWRERRLPPRRLRIAVMTDDAEAPVDATVQAALRDLVAFLRDEGIEVDERARPVASAEAHEVYLHLLRAATGVPYDDETYAAAAKRAAGFERRDASYVARHFRGNASTHRDWVLMDRRREALQRQWAAFFERFDLLICPVATTPAFRQNQKGERWERMIPVNRGEQPSTTQLFWAGYPSIAGLPALAVPLGLSTDEPRGLPIGAQIIGPLFGDPDVIRFGIWLEQAYRAFVPPPLAAALADR